MTEKNDDEVITHYLRGRAWYPIPRDVLNRFETEANADGFRFASGREVFFNDKEVT